ncbi:hypothetical protein JCGZ_09594 [Jatropha curcas]|uniref:Uncharacterized protein n=1 Tax=Jatropha curcas TaxID=180498 RepID=A0A067LKV8_JATCU|nr:hypothetical protein JCGZ_09594 [Jatropha curcas]
MIMASRGMFSILELLFMVLAVGKVAVATSRNSKSNCAFAAIYSFGDSFADTGGMSAAFGPVPPPHGETFFGKPSGRLCDGRLIIDFMAVGKVAVATSRNSKSNCAFAAIYSFGDSFADTGGMSAAFGPVPPPHGETFFGKPSGRLCDGRLIIDFMAEYLGLPYLSAYLDSIGTTFAKGANFASAGSSIRPGPRSPFFLALQVSQFIQFKARTAELYNNSKNRGSLPNPKDFSKALYTFDIGHNDLAFGFLNTTEDQVHLAFPDILAQFSQAVQRLYIEGARAFLVHNVGPIGCDPFGVAMYPPKNTTLDKNRCAVAQNEAVQEFNRQLKDTVVQLRKQLPLAAITYIDVYKVKFSLIDDARNQGFEDPWSFCCGILEPKLVLFCGTKSEDNNTTRVATSCTDPSKIISWDGVHFSEAANKWVVKKLFDGSSSDPPVPINQACP